MLKLTVNGTRWSNLVGSVGAYTRLRRFGARAWGSDLHGANRHPRVEWLRERGRPHARCICWCKSRVRAKSLVFGDAMPEGKAAHLELSPDIARWKIPAIPQHCGERCVDGS